MRKLILISGLVLAFCGIVTLGSLSVLLVLKLAVIILPIVILLDYARRKAQHKSRENLLKWILLRTRQIVRENLPNIKFWYLRLEQKHDQIAEHLHYNRHM